MKKLITNCAKETKQLAAYLAKKFKSGTVALTGELGSGKTTFAQGFALGLGIKEKIISPTFVLIRQYPISKKNLPAGRQVFYHVDLYRVNSFQELGLKEILENQNNIVVIEWAEKIKNLPKKTKKITIEKLEGDKRLITIG